MEHAPWGWWRWMRHSCMLGIKHQQSAMTLTVVSTSQRERERKQPEDCLLIVDDLSDRCSQYQGGSWVCDLEYPSDVSGRCNSCWVKKGQVVVRRGGSERPQDAPKRPFSASFGKTLGPLYSNLAVIY
eukprot:1150961-Pelagomonas_calceolata.AAC.6